MNLLEILNDEILPSVERPSRYLGAEWNTAHKRAEAMDLRVGLVFPDLYDLGLGNLGLLVLYSILNELEWCWAERVYAPAPDMEAALRARGAPLFTNESKTPLAELDLVGFSLQSELTYTNVLNILDLAKLPLRAADRGDAHPLIIAGGPTTYNPEPMAPFMDAIVIGDGEEVIVEIAHELRGMRRVSRRERLDAIAGIEGVYVPERRAPGAVVKRVVASLDAAPFPSHYIVPFTHLIHDRIGLEVMRGCTHGCRFCQAGATGRPVRERSLAKVEALAEEALKDSGYEEIALLSLSTCDYSAAQALVERTAAVAARRGVSVSLPSLRLDSFSVGLADYVTDVRRSGLTFAPEAATPRLRAVINKAIDDDTLFDVAMEAFRRGWGHVKLYFMIGLPTETDEDVVAIAELCTRLVEQARAAGLHGQVHMGVSTFVPKAHTPFQWAEQISMDEIRRRHDLIRAALGRNPAVKFGRHSPESSFIEGLLSRGDRAAADLIEAAWREGARFESWDERLDLDAWLRAVDRTGYDVQAALGARDLDAPMAWDHVDPLITEAWLKEEWQRAMRAESVVDCRRSACHGCGVKSRYASQCAEILDACARKEAAPASALAKSEPPAAQTPAPVQRLRFRIGRRGETRFLSHLELVNAWIRALRRAGAPLAHSQGFHAHAKVTFSSAPPVGEESEGEYMDVLLCECVDPAALLVRLASVLPIGLHAHDVAEAPLHARALMDAVRGAVYTFDVPGERAALEARVAYLLAADALPVHREARVKGKCTRRRPGQGQAGAESLDVRPRIASIVVRGGAQGRVQLDIETQVVDGRGARPRDLLALLGADPARSRVLKRETRLAAD